MRVKSFHSSQESLSPEHRGSVSAAGGNAHTGPPTEAPSGGGGGGVGGGGRLSKACSASALCVHQIHQRENEGRERVGTSKEGVGRTGKEESGGKGASRRRRNKSGSQEKEQGRGGGLSRSATPIRDHRQLYFKGNSQNCSAGLYNRRMSILLLDTVPKVIKGIAASHLGGRRLNKEGFQQRRCWKCHASATSEHISIKNGETLKNPTTKNNEH